MLGDGPDRVVTLTGPGGIGKTRLAVQVATQLLPWLPDGAIFVPLASVTDPAVLLSTIAAALGEPGSAGGEGDTRDRLIAALSQRSPLIVLDNLEHLADAAVLLAPVIRRTPGTRWLITSRSPLDLTAETVVSLAPLALPDTHGEPARDAPSLRLFVSRARDAVPSFELTDANTPAIVEICHRLQGLPLALELAAARIRSLGPETMTRILQRPSGSLDLLQGDADEGSDRRHQTIRRTLLWSCSLLDPGPAALFRQLSVFPGSFTLEAAEAVASPAAGSTLEGLDTLVRSSLILHLPSEDGSSRYDMLQPVRELAREQLTSAGERDETDRRLIVWARTFMQERRTAWVTSTIDDWMASVQAEVENVRAAALLALARDEIEDALRLVSLTLWQYWGMRGLLRDDGAIIEHIMAAAEASSTAIPNEVLAAGYSALATRANGLGEIATARTAYEQALALRRDSDDRTGLSNTLNNYGLMLMVANELDEARGLLEESLALRRTFGQPRATALVLLNLGDLDRQRGRLAEARARFEEVLALSEASGDYRLAGYALMNLGDVTLGEDAPERALSLAEQGLALVRHVGEPHGISQALEIAARAARRLGRTRDASRFLTEALAVNHQRGDRPMVATNLDDIALLLLDVPAAGPAPTGAIHLLGMASGIRELVGSEPPEAIRELTATLRSNHRGPAFLVPWGDGRDIPADRLLSQVERLTEAALSEAVDPPAATDTGTPNLSVTTGPVEAEPDAVRQYRLDPLTAREQDVLALLIDGLSDREIADTLFISARTASNHVARILQKLQVGSRTAAASFALRHGLTQPTPPESRRHA